MLLHPLDSPAPPASDTPIRTLLVFCGSRNGASERYVPMARAVGKLLGEQGIRLVYGGGALGLMGELCGAALAAGGTVDGIIPKFLQDLEVADSRCTNLTVVDSLHQRKQEMFDRADAILALPGGIGTLDEVVEVLSWRNLRLHNRPVWLMDGEFWQPFLGLMQHMVATGFVSPQILGAAEVLETPESLAARLMRP